LNLPAVSLERPGSSPCARQAELVFYCARQPGQPMRFDLAVGGLAQQVLGAAQFAAAAQCVDVDLGKQVALGMAAANGHQPGQGASLVDPWLG
jgi:hypothetical protein